MNRMNSDKNFFSTVGFSYLMIGALSLLFQIIVLNIFNVANADMLNDINILATLTSLCNYILPFPIFYYLMKKLEHFRIKKENLDAKTFIIYLSVTLTLMWIGNIIGLIITSLISFTIQTDIANPITELINTADIWLNLMLISIIGPIFEELIFRKILIDRSIKYGAKVSIFLSALIFAFSHGNLNQFFYAFLIGGFFAYVYIKTGKITYSIILHIFINLMGSVVSLFVSESAQSLVSNNFLMSDMVIVMTYLISLFIMLLLGLYSLIQYKTSSERNEPSIPLKNIILNAGMIGFMLFFTFEIVIQLI